MSRIRRGTARTQYVSRSRKALQQNFWSLSVDSLQASIIGSGKCASSSITSATVKGLLSCVECKYIPSASLSGVAGVASGYLFKSAYSAVESSQYGRSIFLGLSLGILVGSSPLLGINSVIAIASAQFINTYTTKALNSWYGPEASLDPTKTGDKVLNANIWALCQSVSYVAKIGASALLPLSPALVVPFGLFTETVVCGMAERYVMLNLNKETSRVRRIVENKYSALSALACNAVMISTSALNSGCVSCVQVLRTMFAELMRYHSHAECFAKKSAISKCVTSYVSRYCENKKDVHRGFGNIGVIMHA